MDTALVWNIHYMSLCFWYFWKAVKNPSHTCCPHCTLFKAFQGKIQKTTNMSTHFEHPKHSGINWIASVLGCVSTAAPVLHCNTDIACMKSSSNVMWWSVAISRLFLQCGPWQLFAQPPCLKIILIGCIHTMVCVASPHIASPHIENESACVLDVMFY